MSISKYICRCGNKTDTLISYFINGIRITVCDECAKQSELEKKADTKVDYEKIMKSKKDENFYHKIDTREK